MRLLICQDGGKQEVYCSEVIANDLNPRWAPAVVDTMIDYSSSTILEVQCWDRDATRDQDELIGFLRVTIGEIMTDEHWRYFPLKFDMQIHRMGSEAVLDSSPQDTAEEPLRSSEGLFCFQVHTTEEGHNCGKTYVLYAPSREMQQLWVSKMQAQLDKVSANRGCSIRESPEACHRSGVALSREGHRFEGGLLAHAPLPQHLNSKPSIRAAPITKPVLCSDPLT